nr:amidohydrolase [Ruegeria lacuscaerulensis]
MARLTALRHDLHRFPELSGQENNTAARVAGLLTDLGADEVLTGIGGHGVAAVFDGAAPGPTVAIRCELDGLPIQELGDLPYCSQIPGKGHLCGHDGHMVMVLGVADHLAQAPPQKGRVVLIFQPAEETGQGAVSYIADPQFAPIAPDFVFSLHNLPGLALGEVLLCEGPANCASRGMRVMLGGKTSHAAEPQDGISPAEALASLMPELADLGTGGALNADFALTTVTHARLGEPTFGVAPGAAELWVTLRTVSDTRMKCLIAEAEDLVTQTAEAQGLAVKITYEDVFEACTNNAQAVAAVAEACVTEGVPCTLTNEPQKFSEDFGQFGKSAAAAMFWLGAGQAHPQLHNPDYDFPDALIPVGVDVFSAVIRSLVGRALSLRDH